MAGKTESLGALGLLVLVVMGASAACSDTGSVEQPQNGVGGAGEGAVSSASGAGGTPTVSNGSGGGSGSGNGSGGGNGSGSGGGTGGGSGGGSGSGSGGGSGGGTGGGSGSGGGGGIGGVGGGTGGAGGIGGTAFETGGFGGAGGSGGAGGIGGAASTTGGAECSSPADCDDGILCTVEKCVLGACVHQLDSSACDDHLFCNGAELCFPLSGDPVTGCTKSSGFPCDDGVSCTVEACDETTDTCTSVPHDELCDNGITCDGVETCHITLGCKSSGAPSCDDGIACTEDYCDLGSNGCAHVPNDNLCSDGLFCNGAESCSSAGCAPGTPPNCSDNIGCTTDACNEGLDMCEHFPVDSLCDDGKYCNGIEACAPGSGCYSGSPIICDDGLSCTSDACDESVKKCVFSPNQGACNDGLACNGAESCSATGPAPSGCLAGTPVVCAPDGIACTVDACNEATGACTSTANNSSCSPGQLCIPGAGGCTAAKPCTANAECDDGDACNGVETCNVVCQPGVAVDCSDTVSCTIDSCDPGSGACMHTPKNEICDDNFACNGVETCSATNGCVMGVPVDCDDGVACTYDKCEDPSGTCSHFGQDFLCDDGVFCNGAEICSATGCALGSATVCDDGIACTTDKCDPVLDKCVRVPDNTKCGCGETCDPSQGGCGNFCKVATCQGKVYACGDCVDNDGDCKIDSADDQCLGPCDNTEASFYGGIPGQNNSPCKSDCYFDADTGAGNDDCYWSHKCDSLEVGPAYPPEGSQCAYNWNANIPGYSGSCASAMSGQSATCKSYCGPLTPNGCDCFGCCALPNVPYPVWLGSENPSGTGSCNIGTLSDPTKCKPCTQVTSCLNTCEKCEICVGKPDLPPECNDQQCPPGVQKCGQPGQDPCGAGFYCLTGCCVPLPQ